LRSNISAICLASFSVGIVFLNLISFYMTSADSLLMFYTFLLFLLLVPNLKALKESPVWLFKQNRYKEGIKVLQEIAEINARSVATEEYLKALEDYSHKEAIDRMANNEEEPSAGLVDKIKFIWNEGDHLKALIILSSICSALYIVYYGIASSVQDLGFDKIQYNGIATGITQGLGFVFVYPYLNSTPRKFALLCIQGFLALCGGLLFLLSIFPTWSLIRFFEGLIANVLISCVISSLFSFSYLANTESFPPQIRGICVGIILLVGKVLGSLAPLISHACKDLGIHVLAGCSLPMIVSFMLTLGFKETLVTLRDPPQQNISKNTSEA
jgi:Major Facilitator Superfamily